ncbi:MAG: hypothetical protein BGO43_08570 [Gammaproteobacteria bacterium 39-13]|nr:hypothetical protein [Gammaproteobacteria bacterium]OJV94301.1 MAG: hypothetical protein BGO43_08570 [Gammaproteobacteria bacterium 39-13]
MSKFKAVKMSQETISPKMLLLHLRWQQMRLELLQQSASSSFQGNAQPPSHSDKKDYLSV